MTIFSLFLYLILENNDLKCIIRSHTEIRSGCTVAHEGCYTVFSAPNNFRQRGLIFHESKSFLPCVKNVMNVV